MGHHGHRDDLPQESRAHCREMAEHYGVQWAADLYVRVCGQPADQSDARDILSDPYACLEVLYEQYAFARRGRDRFDLADLALKALERSVPPENARDFLNEASGNRLWVAFQEVCEESGKKPAEQLNRGAVSGLAELAQEVWQERGYGSLGLWVAHEAKRTGRIEPLFMRMVDVRGIGPKLAALILRDFAHIFDIESAVDPVDRLYLQPIDKWLRLYAPIVSPEEPSIPDWVLAGKLARAARRSHVSGPLLNMGVSHFGSSVAKTLEALQQEVARVAQTSTGVETQAGRTLA